MSLDNHVCPIEDTPPLQTQRISQKTYHIMEFKRGLITGPLSWRERAVYRWSLQFGEVHTEKSFRNLIISNRYQIEFTIFLQIWNIKQAFICFQINPCMLNTIRYRFDSTQFGKYFEISVCVHRHMGPVTATYWPNLSCQQWTNIRPCQGTIPIGNYTLLITFQFKAI